MLSRALTLLALLAVASAATASQAYYVVEPIVPESLFEDLRALNEAYFKLHQLDCETDCGAHPAQEHIDEDRCFFECPVLVALDTEEGGITNCPNEIYLNQEVVYDEEARVSHLLLHVYQTCKPHQAVKLQDISLTILSSREIRVEARTMGDKKDSASFVQDFALEHDDDDSTLTATYEQANGLITISVKKLPEIVRKQIEVTLQSACEDSRGKKAKKDRKKARKAAEKRVLQRTLCVALPGEEVKDKLSWVSQKVNTASQKVNTASQKVNTASQKVSTALQKVYSSSAAAAPPPPSAPGAIPTAPEEAPRNSKMTAPEEAPRNSKMTAPEEAPRNSKMTAPEEAPRNSKMTAPEEAPRNSKMTAPEEAPRNSTMASVGNERGISDLEARVQALQHEINLLRNAL